MGSIHRAEVTAKAWWVMSHVGPSGNNVWTAKTT
jgi:hypothetical protein